MEILDAATAIAVGDLDARYARLLALSTVDRLAAALIDTNGDGVSITLDDFEADGDGRWIPGISRSAGDAGALWTPRMASAWGRGNPGQTVAVRYAGRGRGCRRAVGRAANGEGLSYD